MFEEQVNEYLPPSNTNTFRIPNDPELRVQCDLYRPSIATRRLYSERYREVYAEAFIEHENLGTLADLSARALAQMSNRFKAPPGMEQQFNDGLDINLPLQDCYHVEDLSYWRRVVLAKTTDQSLQLKKVDEYDWRGMGISLKYVQLVEACPAAYWPERQMAHLAELVRPFMRTMHIRHLQSLTPLAFSHYVDSDAELDASSAESEQSAISSDESDTQEELDEEGEEEEGVTSLRDNKSIIRLSVTSVVSNTYVEQQQRREARHARNNARQLLRRIQAEQQLDRELRKRSRALLQQKPAPAPKVKKKKENKSKGKGKGKDKPPPIETVFDLEVKPEPVNLNEFIKDKRNRIKYLERLKRYDYPAKHCHHIDLSFVRYFVELKSLTLEFLGPHMGAHYEQRHLNFSYDDMRRLAKGLRCLQQLKIFRLRHSRMDSFKLLILARAISQLDGLELVDFSYDQLADDCDIALKMLLERVTMFKALELEYNKLDSNCMEALGYALKQHYLAEPAGNALEYLGLAHNPISNAGLIALVNNIVGTHHVQELNVAGIETRPQSTVQQLSFLLRKHEPLRALNIVALALNEKLGHQLICSLETNYKVTQFDCRGCGLSVEQELEAELIVQRNNYKVKFPFVGATTETEEQIEAHLAVLKHPGLERAKSEVQSHYECLRNRPDISSSASSLSIKEPEQQDSVLTDDIDIWQQFIERKSQLATQAKSVTSSNLTAKSERSTFHFDANSFTLEQLRQHMFVPGTVNRHYYFEEQKKRFQF